MAALQHVVTRINSSSTTVVLMRENISLVSVLVKVLNSLPPSIVSFKSLFKLLYV